MPSQSIITCGTALSLTSGNFISGLDVINILAVITAPSIPILLGWGWKVKLRMGRRISELEDESIRHSRTLYGDADDPTHNGLAEELSEIKSTLGTMEREITYISRALDSERLNNNRDSDGSRYEDDDSQEFPDDAESRFSE